MLVRAWNSADNKSVANLEKMCFSDAWSYDMVCETANNESFCGVVCEENNSVIGYAGAILAYDVADIALVAVSPDYRRKGYGFELLQNLERILIEKGVSKIFLEVRKSNLNAQKLYKKCGFISVGERKKYYENTEDAIVMLKVIAFE